MKKMLAILFAAAAVTIGGIPGKAIAGPVIASSPDMVPNAFVMCGGQFSAMSNGCKANGKLYPYEDFVKATLGEKARLVGMQMTGDSSGNSTYGATLILYAHIDK